MRASWHTRWKLRRRHRRLEQTSEEAMQSGAAIITVFLHRCSLPLLRLQLCVQPFCRPSY